MWHQWAGGHVEWTSWQLSVWDVKSSLLQWEDIGPVSFDESRKMGSSFYGLHNVKARLKAQQEGSGHLESSWRNLPKGGWEWSETCLLSLSQLPWMENVVSYLDQYHCPFLRDPMQMLSYTCSVVNRNRAIKLRPQNCPKRWLWYWKAQLLPNSPSDILIIRSCLCWWIFRTRLRRQKHKAWVGS